MRVAVSGSHGTGKSTLIAGFLARHPSYVHEPEAFECLADEIDLTPSEGPTPDGLRLLLDHSISAVGLHQAGEWVVFERSPVDYLAYAAASRRGWSKEERAEFLSASIPRVREAMRNLDLVAFLPVSSRGLPPRPGENPRFRERVDEALRRALLDDDYDLFGQADSPRVVELSASPARQLGELVQMANAIA